MMKKGWVIWWLTIMFTALWSGGALKSGYANANMADLGDIRQQKISAINIFFNYNAPPWAPPTKLLPIKDKKVIADILSMLEQSRLLDKDEKTKYLGGYKKHHILQLITRDHNRLIFFLDYDPCFWVGYVDLIGRKYEADRNLLRYVDSLYEYKMFDTAVDPQVIKLFKKSHWTIDYKVNAMKEILPETLKHRAGEFPLNIYWAYNNELSKSIGLDFSKYLGQTVDVEIYRLREALPDFLQPQYDARGVVLKSNGQIVGAYIDTGRHTAFACSLDRKSLQEVTGKDWGEWVDDYIDYNDELEQRLAAMEPEDVVKQFYAAMDRHDMRTLSACLTRKYICRSLATNMDNNLLHNPPEIMQGHANLESIKILRLRKWEMSHNPEGTVEYEVSTETVTKDGTAPGTKEDRRFIYLKKETLRGGWRIEQIGCCP